jgi:hypothetical protein
MSGPWYEQQSPSTEDVKKILFTARWDSQFGKTSWYPMMKRRVIDIVIHEELKEHQKTFGEQPCWGSYRGYYSFSHSELLNKCLEEGQKFIKEKARKKLLKFMNDSTWIQDRLYRPDDGLRWEQIENILLTHQQCAQTQTI